MKRRGIYDLYAIWVYEYSYAGSIWIWMNMEHKLNNSLAYKPNIEW